MIPADNDPASPKQPSLRNEKLLSSLHLSPSTESHQQSHHESDEVGRRRVSLVRLESGRNIWWLGSVPSRRASAIARRQLRGFHDLYSTPKAASKGESINCIGQDSSVSNGSVVGNVLASDLSDLSTTASTEEDLSPTNGHAVTMDCMVRQSEILEESYCENVPVVYLGKFQKSVWLDFGGEDNNSVDNPRCLPLRIQAPPIPDENGFISVEFERFPYKKGFNVTLENVASSGSDVGGDRSHGMKSNESSSFQLSSHSSQEAYELLSLHMKPGELRTIFISWNPIQEGGIREVIHLKLPRGRQQVVLVGSARGPQKIEHQFRRISTESVNIKDAAESDDSQHKYSSHSQFPFFEPTNDIPYFQRNSPQQDTSPLCSRQHSGNLDNSRGNSPESSNGLSRPDTKQTDQAKSTIDESPVDESPTVLSRPDKKQTDQAKSTIDESPVDESPARECKALQNRDSSKPTNFAFTTPTTSRDSLRYPKCSDNNTGSPPSGGETPAKAQSPMESISIDNCVIQGSRRKEHTYATPVNIRASVDSLQGEISTMLHRKATPKVELSPANVHVVLNPFPTDQKSRNGKTKLDPLPIFQVVERGSQALSPQSVSPTNMLIVTENLAKHSPLPTTPIVLKGSPSDLSISSHSNSSKKVDPSRRIPSPKTSPRGSMASASKLIHKTTFDTKWEEKQSVAFANWLNYLFRPSDDIDTDENLRASDGDSTVDRRAFRTLLLLRQRSAEWDATRALFTSSEMKGVRSTIETEVAKGHLAMKSDCNILADVRLRKQLTSVLLSYSPRWLHLGLHMLIKMRENNSQSRKETVNKLPTKLSKAMTKKIIMEQVLSDPATLMKFTKGRCKVPSGTFEKKLRLESQRQALTKLLILVVFLDRAKCNRILERNPCLFLRSSEIKSSKDVLIALCRDCLSGGTNIVKELRSAGISVAHVQAPLDEYQYALTNLLGDLKDGIRLSKMAEVLTKDTKILPTIRFPAVSRLRKIHNAGVSLSTLKSAKLPDIGEITAAHIVDGKRSQILDLLWSSITFFQLPSLLSPFSLKEEIRKVSRLNRSKGGRDCSSSIPSDGSISSFVDDSTNSSFGIASMLLLWCRVVCSLYDVPVENFTTSFVDGKVLCLLVNHYHPHMISIHDILPSTRDLPDMFHHQVVPSEEPYKTALQNERHNAAMAISCMAELGGIPKLLSEVDLQNIPEEKSMILWVSFLFSRLVESRRETDAIISIQKWYRHCLA